MWESGGNLSQVSLISYEMTFYMSKQRKQQVLSELTFQVQTHSLTLKHRKTSIEEETLFIL